MGRPLLVAVIVLGWASAASAGVLTMASWTQEVGPFEVGVPVTGEGSAIGRVPRPGFDGCACLSLSVPSFQHTVFLPKSANGVLDLAYLLQIGGQQHLTATFGGARATQGIPGTILLKTAVHAAMGVNASMYQVGAITLLRVPLSVGAGATQMGTFSVLNEPHSFTVHQYAWTPSTLTFTGLTSRGNPLPDVVAMGTFVGPGDGQPGEITLVAPTLIEIRGALAERRTVTLSSVKLFFDADESHPFPVCVPEPGEAALLATGFAAWLIALRRSAA